MYNSVDFSIFTDINHHHYNLILEHFYLKKKNSMYPLPITTLLPYPLFKPYKTINLLSVSIDVAILDVSYEGITQYVSSITGFFYLE